MRINHSRVSFLITIITHKTFIASKGREVRFKGSIRLIANQLVTLLTTMCI